MTGILTIVTEEVETILDIYESSQGEKYSGVNSLKSQLINYVMRHIQTDRSIQVYLSAPSAQLKLPYRSLELRLKIEGYARSGLQHLQQTPVNSPRSSGSQTLLA